MQVKTRTHTRSTKCQNSPAASMASYLPPSCLPSSVRASITISSTTPEKTWKPWKPGGKPYTEVNGLKKVPIDYSAQYANNFAELWSVWLLTRSGVP